MSTPRSMHKSKKGNNRKVFINEKWVSQKEYLRNKISEEQTREIYGKRKIDVETVLVFLKANLCFARFSVHGKEKVENELGFALMAVNLRRFTARNNNPIVEEGKNSSKQILALRTIFWLVMSQPNFFTTNEFVDISREILFKSTGNIPNRHRSNFEKLLQKQQLQPFPNPHLIVKVNGKGEKAPFPISFTLLGMTTRLKLLGLISSTAFAKAISATDITLFRRVKSPSS